MKALRHPFQPVTRLSTICLIICALPLLGGVNSTPTLVTTGVGRIILSPEAYSNEGKAVLALGTGKLLVASSSHAVSTTEEATLMRLYANGAVDRTFGGGTGVAVMPNATGRSLHVYNAALQADGKVVVVGIAHDGNFINCDFAVMRFNADGSADTSFGTNGITITDMGSDTDFGLSVAIDSANRIVLGGQHKVSGSTYDFCAARYTPAGVLDATFSGDGKAYVTIPGTVDCHLAAITLQSDDKIILVGSAASGTTTAFGVVRLDTSGVLDTGFGTAGVLTTDPGSTAVSSCSLAADVQVDAAGNILVVGSANNLSGASDIALVRYTPLGAPDTTFNGTGKKIVPVPGVDGSHGISLAVLPSGQILVAGYADINSIYDYNFLTLRFSSTGTLDAGFNGNGIQMADFGFSGETPTGNPAVQGDGKVLVVGSAGNSDAATMDVALVRYNTDGTLDTSFGKPAYLLGGGGTPLRLNAQAMDYELADVVDTFTSDNFGGATLTLARQGGANAEDVFSNTGTLGSLSTGTGTLTVDSTSIGTYSQSLGTLILHFNGSSSSMLVNRVMQQLTYANTGTTEGVISLLWSLDDGNTGAQGTGGAMVGTAVSTVNLVTYDPTVISLTSFTAQARTGQVKLAWTTGSEVDTAGFHLWRSPTAGGNYTRLTPDLLPATGLSPAGASYAWIDGKVNTGETWFYRLEDIDTAGQSTFHGPVSATLGTSGILSFQAVPMALFAGGSSLLSWTVNGTPALFLNGEALTGSNRTVSPLATTAYTLLDAQGDQQLVTLTVKAFGFPDMAGLSKAWGSRKGEAAFDPSYDLNSDGQVDDVDVAICFQGF